MREPASQTCLQLLPKGECGTKWLWPLLTDASRAPGLGAEKYTLGVHTLMSLKPELCAQALAGF